MEELQGTPKIGFPSLVLAEAFLEVPFQKCLVFATILEL
jgi:hypothetical protein